jgi:hypothetical protein
MDEVQNNGFTLHNAPPTKTFKFREMVRTATHIRQVADSTPDSCFPELFVALLNPYSPFLEKYLFSSFGFKFASNTAQQLTQRIKLTHRNRGVGSGW